MEVSQIKRIFFPTCLFLLVSLLLSSCLPAPVEAAQSISNPSTVQAAIVQTVESDLAQQTDSALTNTPTPTLTETPTETPTSTPTSSPTPTITNIPTIQLPLLAVAPCYGAAFITDVTVPDGTQFDPGADFTKTWRIQNTGSCAWTTSFQVIFNQGDLLGAPSSFNLPNYVNPGQTVDISVGMTAPDNTGTYQGSWRLEAPNGITFGVGTSNVDFFVQIVVGTTSSSFEVREIDLSADNSAITTNCRSDLGNQFTFTAEIRTNQSGKVVYYWEFSNDTRTDEHTITIDDSHRRTVTTTISTDQTGNFWARLHIVQPDDIRSDKISFSLTCQTQFPIHPRPLRPTPTITPTPTKTPVPSITPTPSVTPTRRPTRKQH